MYHGIGHIVGYSLWISDMGTSLRTMDIRPMELLKIVRLRPYPPPPPASTDI